VSLRRERHAHRVRLLVGDSISISTHVLAGPEWWTQIKVGITLLYVFLAETGNFSACSSN
jgi:hypothetical protein